MPGLRIIGTAKNKASVISFVVEDPPLSPLDLGTRLDREGDRRPHRAPLLPCR